MPFRLSKSVVSNFSSPMPETQRLDIATNGYAGATLIAAHSAM
jgi:hypothetical protein